MSTMWDNLGEQIRTWTNTAAERAGTFTRAAGEKAGTFTRAAANKAEELSKASFLKVDIYQLQRERNRLYADLGSLAYRRLEQATGPALRELPGVEELRLRIAGLGAKIVAREDELRQASDHEDAARRKAAAKAEPAAKPKSTAASRRTSRSKPAAKGKKGSATARKPAAKKKTVK